MSEILIKGGTIIDGTGSDRYVADLAISDGHIVAMGTADTPDLAIDAADTIDATGHIVCPGFIDPHTHYDAQIFWDPHASPSNIHGVTTAIMGNCGFTLAPTKTAEDVDYIKAMMVKVEGMPPEALDEGVTWDFHSFAEYLDRLEGKVGINIGSLVGHCALRRAVMGEEATAGEASEAQITEMQGLLEESIEAGGLGFSTTRAYTHSDGDGIPAPSRHASEQEVLTLAETVAKFEGTTLEWVSDGCLDGFEDDEVELMAKISLAGQRPLNWNVLTVDAARPDDYKSQIAALETCNERGAKVIALTMPILVGMNMSFGTYCALNMLPGWGDILSLPIEDRKKALRDPEVRRQMETSAASPEAGVFSRLTGWGLYEIGDTNSDTNEGLKGRRVADIARERGVRDFYALLDIVLEDDLKTVIWPGPTDDDPASWMMRQQTWDHPNVMIGGSDAGAHLDRMAGAPYTTTWLADTIRGRQLTTLEAAVSHMTKAPAELFGLTDRGVLREGAHADIVIFDPETVDATDVIMVNDLPGDAKRLYAESIGISRVLVNGVVTVVDGTSTDDLPGIVLRSGRDTETVAI